MKKGIIFIFLIFSLIFIIGVSGCETYKSFVTVNDSSSLFVGKDVLAKLEIHDNSPKSLFIQNDGNVILTELDTIFVPNLPEGEKYPWKQTQKTVQVSLKEIESLKQVILENKFFSLKERDKEDEEIFCKDAIGNTITITIGNNTRSVYCAGCINCPKEFENVLEKIKSLWPYEIEVIGFA